MALGGKEPFSTSKKRSVKKKRKTGRRKGVGLDTWTTVLTGERKGGVRHWATVALRGGQMSLGQKKFCGILTDWRRRSTQTPERGRGGHQLHQDKLPIHGLIKNPCIEKKR